MSATNHTTNYELPIFVGTDKPAWLVDWNGAMAAIDTAIHTAEGKADQAGTDIGGIESSISTINSTLTSINSAVSQLRIDTNANTGSINTITSLIGNGEPTTTDKTIIGAINEINATEHDIEPVVVHTVIADGVKTYTQLLSEIYSHLPVGATTEETHEELTRYELVIETYEYNGFTVASFVGNDTNGAYSFTTLKHRPNENAFMLLDYKVGSSVANCGYYYMNLTNAGSTPGDGSAEVPASGDKIIVYRI